MRCTDLTTLSRRRLHWPGHVRRMSDERFLKDLIYGELVGGKLNGGRPTLCYKDACKCELKSINIPLYVERFFKWLHQMALPHQPKAVCKREAKRTKKKTRNWLFLYFLCNIFVLLYFLYLLYFLFVCVLSWRFVSISVM